MADRTPRQFHCDAFLAANANGEVHKTPHRFDRPPIAGAGIDAAPDRGAVARRMTTSLLTRQSSFDVWAALAGLEALLSDYRRLAPRFTFEQLTGQPSVAAGNEYRLTMVDGAALSRIEAACGTLAGEDRGGALGGARRMDVRVVRAGPWGGETGEMVVEALENHAMAGMASLWVVVHGEGTDGMMRVRLDMLEIARWAWAPDCLAARSVGDAAGSILDWPYMFERLAEILDGLPVAETGDGACVPATEPEVLLSDERLRDALSIHPVLAQIARHLTR